MSAPVAVGATTGLDQDAIGGRRVTQNSSTTNLTNHPGATRLARGLAALVEAQERRPRTAAEACVLRGLEAMLGVRKLRQLAPTPAAPILTGRAQDRRASRRQAELLNQDA